jgi:Rod binding domain-containing protein
MIELQVRAAVDTTARPAEQSLRLHKAAQDFEALLIQDLLNMAKDEDSSQEPGMAGYEDMRTEAIATAMASNGGIGVGKLLIGKLDRLDGADRLKLSHHPPIT